MRDNGDRNDLPLEQVDPFGLGNLLGRWQAFGFIAGRCSAADVECLREIRKRKLYRSKTGTWAHFCTRYLGLSRPQADRLLQYLDEFGANYFHLSQIVRVSPQTYRLIAHAVREDGIEFHGTPIPLTQEYAGQVLRAVRELRRTTPRALLPASAAAWEPRRGKKTDPRIIREQLRRLAARLDAVTQRLATFSTLGLEPEDEAFLLKAADKGMKRLAGLKLALRH